uniref:V-type proton ATPase subunit G n=1 Tax=Panagrolaimus sp. PS1159 TaxID=55785 RepID=A0AC35EWH8_9BILA
MSELEGKFAQFERENHGNRDETQKIIDAEIEKELQEMEKHVAENRDAVINRILNLVCDIQPELHHNLQLQQKLSAQNNNTNNTEGA